MKQRLYFLLPDVEAARQMGSELALARVHDEDVHFLARDDLSDTGLNEATLLQRSDMVHGAGIGLVIGGMAGVLVGFLTVQLAGPPFQIGTMLVTGLIGAVFGAWTSSMIGSSVPNSYLKEFEPALERGYILALVDVPKRYAARVGSVLERHHTELARHT